MSSAIKQVNCLHLPELTGGNIADICWEAVEDAAEYEVEACFNTEFGDAAATGKSWSGIQSENKTWAQINSVNDWSTIEALPASYAVYIGAGTAVPSPDAGLTWAQCKSLDKTWSAINLKDLTWAELLMLHAAGLTWNSVDALHLEFGQADQKSRSWDELEESEPDQEPHVGCCVNIPNDTRYATFCIRACDVDGNRSSALYTAKTAVSTSETIEIPPVEADKTLYAEGRQMHAGGATRYKLSYDPAQVAVISNKMQLHEISGQADALWSKQTATFNITSKTNEPADLRLDWYKVD